MKKMNYVFGLLAFVIMIPKVYAFTYEVEAVAPGKSYASGSETEIKVNLKNVKETELGIASCSLKLDYDDTIVLNPRVRTLGNWTLTKGEVYLFDTGDFAVDESALMVIPVKVLGSGSVVLSNIECSDGETLQKVEDVRVDFATDTNSKPQNDVKSSNCDLSNILLNEGTIAFDSNITEYEVAVSNFDNLVVEAVLAHPKATYEINRTEDKKINIRVVAEDGSSKSYTIVVKEAVANPIEKKNNNQYVPIFIAIIAVLIAINVFRIVRNRSK